MRQWIFLAVTALLMVLASCQGTQPEEMSGSVVNRQKVVSAFDKYQLVEGDWAQQYANLSVEEMALFIELLRESDLEALRRLESNPVAERNVPLDSQWREVEVRSVRLGEEELEQERARVESVHQNRLMMHRLSVERYGRSFNGITGTQLDELGSELNR